MLHAVLLYGRMSEFQRTQLPCDLKPNTRRASCYERHLREAARLG